MLRTLPDYIYARNDVMAMHIRSCHETALKARGMGAYSGWQSWSDEACDKLREAAYLMELEVSYRLIEDYLIGANFTEAPARNLYNDEMYGYEYRLEGGGLCITVPQDWSDEQLRSFNAKITQFLEGWSGEDEIFEDGYADFGSVTIREAKGNA